MTTASQVTTKGRKAALLDSHLDNKLLAYVTAASAAGVGMLALTQPAEAKIVYHHVHRVIGPGHNYSLDLNQDKVADFKIRNFYGCNQDYCYDLFSALPAARNGVEGKKGFLGIPYAYALSSGALIGPKQPFSGQLMASDNMGTLGRWLNVADRYLGLKFKIKGNIHYGWARFNVVDHSPRITATLTGYAYETAANKPIKAGRTKGTDDASLRQGSLGGLAQGSSGTHRRIPQSKH